MESSTRNVVVLDSGGSTCKLGFAGEEKPTGHFPNAVAKASGSQSMLVGEEILKQLDVSSIALRRPVDRGYVVHWDVQKDIWSSSFKKLLSGKKQDSLGIVLTEPYLNLSSMRDRCMKILLEDMKFSSVLMLYPATLCMHYLSHLARESETLSPARLALRAGAGVVIDAGFSFTHIVPMFDWKPIKRSIRRIDLGGKALTNYMKELVSYRSMNMMKETYLMEHIKDELCFVSHNVEKDLKASKSKKSPFRTEWFLPDGVTSKWGHIRDPSQPRDPSDPILVVNNERFMVPEALFHPSDIGMEEAGLAEGVLQAVQSAHPNLHGLLFSNVVVIGGMAKCPGFRERLFNELRPLVFDDYELHIFKPDEPDVVAWKGGSVLGSSEMYQRLAVSQDEWKQYGSDACAKWEL